MNKPGCSILPDNGVDNRLRIMTSSFSDQPFPTLVPGKKAVYGLNFENFDLEQDRN
jgi:hypothetical protein